MIKIISGTIVAFLVMLIGNGFIYAAVNINEIMIDPQEVSDTYGEWLELYNDGTESVDVNAWVVKDADSNHHVINNEAPLLISPDGFLLLGRNGEVDFNGDYLPDYVYEGFILSNTEDEVILEDNLGTEISRLEYSNGTWPIYSGRSLAFSGVGDINSPEYWFATEAISDNIFGAGDYGTPGASNTIPEPSTLFLMLAGVLTILTSKKCK
ncbi:MAG: PEP-CTERM sorting domain-containing protein [PVC group bacterium]|nr:PEP-CTERM sorting domain-containing protein [PVC group bacterium]